MSKEFEAAFEAATTELAGGDAGGTVDTAAAVDTSTATPAGDAATPAELPSLNPDENWTKEAKEAFAALAGNPEHRKYAETWLNEHKKFDGTYRQTQAERDRLQHEHAQANQWLQQFHGILSPYAAEYQRAGMSPIAGVQRALAWEAYIRENPREAIAQLAQQAGVDLTQIGEAGQQQWVDPHTKALQQQVQALQGGIGQVTGFIQQYQQQQQQSAFTGALSEIEAFKTQQDESGNPKFPFFDDVIGEMKQLVDMANASGQPITLEQAYGKAIRLSDSAWTKAQEAEKRQREEQAKKDAAARLAEANKANKARGANSPAGRGGAPGPASARSARDAIDLAMDELSKR